MIQTSNIVRKCLPWLNNIERYLYLVPYITVGKGIKFRGSGFNTTIEGLIIHFMDVLLLKDAIY